jgi:hypothetical protein
MKIIGVVGSRRRDRESDFQLVRQEIEKQYEKGDKLCSGGCPKGADKFAEDCATCLDIPIIIHRADWDKHGKAAGFIRNTDIAKDSNMLIAVVAPDRTGGTEDTIKKFKKFHPDGELILL